MTLTIDSVCKRYGLLPSDFMNRGNSLDLYVADLANQFEAWVHKKQQTKGHLAPDPIDTPSEEQMKAMIQSVRKKQ